MQNSDLWLWLGDAAYVDSFSLLGLFTSYIPVNFTLAEEIFNKSKSNECIKFFI